MIRDLSSINKFAVFIVLTISADTLSVCLSLPSIKVFSVGAVGLWLASLLCGLVVVTPRKWQSDSGRPDTQNQVFRKILRYKLAWLKSFRYIVWPGNHFTRDRVDYRFIECIAR